MKKIPEFGKGQGTPSKKTKHEPAAPVKVKVKAKAKGKGSAAVIATAAMLALPMLMAPLRADAQATGVKPPISPTNPSAPPVKFNYSEIKVEYHTIKLPGTYTVLGEGDGHTIFKGQDGHLFYLDPNTGDKKSVAVDYFLKIGDIKGSRAAASTKHGGGTGWIPIKGESTVSIVGADARGNTVMQNARHETFILDPKTGNQVFIKWPK